MRTLPDFALERYFARWEFAVRHVLCASDVEALTLRETLALADDETRALWDSLALGYGESAGLPLLREAIAATYEGVRPDEVLVATGAEEAIFLAFLALAGPGDHVVVACPAYQSLFEVARAAGAEVTLLPLDESRGWSLDADDVRRALRPSTRAVVVNFPHSPTGGTVERDAFEAIVQLVEGRGATLFSDEVYRRLEHGDRAPLPQAVELGERTVSLGVMSKSYGLPGLRVGWIATHDDALRRRVAALRDYTTICGSVPSELLAVMALRARDAVLARNRAIIGGNLRLLHDFMGRWEGRLAWVPPRGSSVAFPRLLRGDAERFCASLVEREGVLLLPGALFGMAGGHFRIGYGRRDFGEALVRLEGFLASPAGEAALGGG
jgi:aspartate/methionine/tyrosine aminotransferase